MEFTYTESLKNEVPKEIRLEVYKRAKKLIENWKEGIFKLKKTRIVFITSVYLIQL